MICVKTISIQKRALHWWPVIVLLRFRILSPLSILKTTSYSKGEKIKHIQMLILKTFESIVMIRRTERKSLRACRQQRRAERKSVRACTQQRRAKRKSIGACAQQRLNCTDGQVTLPTCSHTIRVSAPCALTTKHQRA